MKRTILFLLIALLATTGVVFASQAPPTVFQNGNTFSVSVQPADGSVRNWVYYLKASPVGKGNNTEICISEGGHVSFQAVSVLSDDNTNSLKSQYTQWYQVPDGSCTNHKSPPPNSVPSTSEVCRVAQEHAIQGETLSRYRVAFPNAKNPSYPDIVEIWNKGSLVTVMYDLDGFHTHTDGRSGEIWGVEIYHHCTFLRSAVWFVPFSWHGGDILTLAKNELGK